MEPTPQSVESARDAYLARNGFTVESYSARWTPASFMGIPFVVPNTTTHRWAIMMHDLHHVTTGYGTDIPGEGEISAWELRRGLTGLASMWARSSSSARSPVSSSRRYAP